MKERPILFKGEMVRAILEGRKTQTRRAYKIRKHPDLGCEMAASELVREPQHFIDRMCPYGQPGDRLWVRETWQGPLLDSEEHEAQFREDGPEAFKKPGFCAYRATDTLDAINEDGEDLGWRPSIHMPRWASRISLEITCVRVERLKDISEADAKAEGAEPAECCYAHYHGFSKLWQSINGPGSWDANPWVWVVEFKRVQP